MRLRYVEESQVYGEIKKTALIAGQSIDVGTVSVYKIEGNLKVVYELNEWALEVIPK